MTQEQLKRIESRINNSYAEAPVHAPVTLTPQHEKELHGKVDHAMKLVDKTNASPVPFAVHSPEQTVVVGDANQTEVKMADYTIKFRVPAVMLPEDVEVLENRNGYSSFITKKSNVFITPRKNIPLMKRLMDLYPLRDQLAQFGADEDLEGLDEQTAVVKAQAMLTMLSAGNYLIIDTLYEVVALLLDVPPGLVDFMTTESVIQNFVTLVETHPEAFNETEVFFG